VWTLLYPKRRRVGKTVAGWLQALQRIGRPVLKRMAELLRPRIALLLADGWTVDGWIPFAGDGSRLALPRTAELQRALSDGKGGTVAVAADPRARLQERSRCQTRPVAGHQRAGEHEIVAADRQQTLSHALGTRGLLSQPQMHLASDQIGQPHRQAGRARSRTGSAGDPVAAGAGRLGHAAARTAAPCQCGQGRSVVPCRNAPFASAWLATAVLPQAIGSSCPGTTSRSHQHQGKPGTAETLHGPRATNLPQAHARRKGR